MGTLGALAWKSPAVKKTGQSLTGLMPKSPTLTPYLSHEEKVLFVVRGSCDVVNMPGYKKIGQSNFKDGTVEYFLYTFNKLDYEKKTKLPMVN